MRVARETKDDPEIQKEVHVPRFFWTITRNWQQAKGQNKVDQRFWEHQGAALEAFDKKNPNQKYEKPAEKPKLPLPALHVMVAAGSQIPTTTPAPPPPAQRRSTPTPVPAQRLKSTPLSSVQSSPQRPATRRRGKGKGRREVDSDDDEAPSPTKRPRQNKGKGRMVESDSDDDDRDEEGEKRPAPAPVPVPIPALAPAPVPRRADVQLPPQGVIRVQPSQPPPKRPVPESNGQRRKPACKRCVKGGRTCYAQKGFATACVGCAKIKMRCEPVSEDEGGKRKVDEPAPARKPAFRQPAPGGSRPPAPGGSKQPAREVNPASGLKKRKVTKKLPPVVISSDGETSPPRKRTFAELEKSDGKFHRYFTDIFNY
jgi:hypothetical protein